MELEDFSSDPDDDDYIPNAAEESDDQQICSDENEVNSDGEIKTTKSRKQTSKKQRNTRKRKSSGLDTHDDESDESKSADHKIDTNPEEAKRRKEELWSDFLKDTKTTAKPSPKTNVVPVEKANSKINNGSSPKKESKIFNFAGEVVKVKEVESVPADLKAEPDVKPQSSTSSPSSSTIKSKGLGSILGKITNKGTKLSTLDKSKLDWNEFKADEGIEEELSFHNKGKNGYLERQAFLQRTDFRQFEIEKELRSSSHSKDKRR